MRIKHICVSYYCNVIPKFSLTIAFVPFNHLQSLVEKYVCITTDYNVITIIVEADSFSFQYCNIVVNFTYNLISNWHWIEIWQNIHSIYFSRTLSFHYFNKRIKLEFVFVIISGIYIFSTLSSYTKLDILTQIIFQLDVTK